MKREVVLRQQTVSYKPRKTVREVNKKLSKEMQRFKRVLQLQHSLESPAFLSQYRTFLAQSKSSPQDDTAQNQVLVEGKSNSRIAVLNRPSSLNAINTSMVARLKRLYDNWEENPDLGFLMIKGNGRAFCSGADVVSLYQLINDGKVDECKNFFDALYKFVYLMGTYDKPHVAILDGYTMGAGASICLPGTFKLVTDKTVFSHPETQLGFHPDAGASYYLSRLPGYLGEYLALTGDKLNGIDMIASGLATHYCLSARLPLVEDRLGKLITDLPSVIESSLAQYGDLVYPENTSVIYKIETIDKCFSHDTIEEIFDALEKEAADTSSEWCISTLQKLKEASPLSLKITLRSIRDGRFQTLDKCLAREYRISSNCISQRVSSDFCEGVRARLVDKDFAPKWDPPTLEDVGREMVDTIFSPLGEFEPELELPTSLREPDI